MSSVTVTVTVTSTAAPAILRKWGTWHIEVYTLLSAAAEHAHKPVDRQACQHGPPAKISEPVRATDDRRERVRSYG